MATPNELNTCILGRTFVGVSVRYKARTMSTKILSLAKVSGRSYKAFGKMVQMIKKIVMPVNKNAVNL